mgnify:CR=1 FL=1
MKGLRGIPFSISNWISELNAAPDGSFPTLFQSSSPTTLKHKANENTLDIDCIENLTSASGYRQDTNLQKLKLQIKNDSIEYERTKELHKIGAVSQANFEAMTLAYEVSKKTYSNLLENTILRSPISGIITARNYDEGDMYAMAQPLFVVQNITPVKMLINISESNYSKISKGMEVDIVADAFPGETFKGKVNLIYPTIDPRSHTFPVEITIDNKDEKLRPGMFARVTVNYGNNFRVVVPDNAVLKQVGADEKYVYVLNEDGTVTHTPVKVGVRMGKRYEIISGIDDGATIVTSGQTRLRNNIKVDIVK